MKVHMMGIGGSGMSGVANLASEMGYEVTGCDLESQTAYQKNIFKGHSPEHLKGIDLLVVTPAVYYQNKKNAELIEGEKRGIATTWEKFVGNYLAVGKKMICIAGTHGKSTTTAMAGSLLTDADLDPLVVVGANVPWWNGNSRFGKGEYFVVEADEFNNNFLNYSPEIIILNNIEFDHPDFFKDEKAVFESFKKFIDCLTGMKILIVNKDSPGVQKLLGMIDKSDLEIIEYSPDNDKLGFDLSLPGKHNIANALGVVALGKLLDINERIINKSLSSFPGIGRRMELIADKHGIKVYDDYAHHPTAIAATLQALREKYPANRILAIDEPHGFARTKALLSLYKDAFKDADKLMIGPIFKARDSETFGMTPQIVAEKAQNSDSVGYDSFEKIKSILQKDIRPSDIILVMGAGKSYLWAREISKLIK
ncbi:MAG: UDP-N-acetylmuramate--L-alanine ligase [Candidatus Microgenomates bacterium]|jgi:UDP-N-acetylmuramate--alanine ligase